MCSITPETANVGSSYNRMQGPGIGCWFSDRSHCRHWSLTLTFTLTSENISLLYSVAHCSRSQDIDLFKFQLSYCYIPLQDTCPITSAVLGHLMKTHVPLIFLHRDKKSPSGCLKMCNTGYIPLYYLYWPLYNYAAHAADILSPTTVVQGVDNHSWGLYCRRCYCIRSCWGYSTFSRWLGQLSTVLTKDESPHTGCAFTPWVVSFTPPSIEHLVGGTSILRLIRTTMESHEKDSGNPDRTAWQV